MENDELKETDRRNLHITENGNGYGLRALAKYWEKKNRIRV